MVDLGPARAPGRGRPPAPQGGEGHRGPVLTLPADAPRRRRRDYERILAALEGRWKRRPCDRPKMMHDIVEALWDCFGGRSYSWCGFYCPTPDGKELVLGPHRDKPACSPIAARGVCGRAAAERTTQVVADVKALGKDRHVECDPAYRSEIAVPALDLDGNVFAVLDVDSTEPTAFDEDDRRWLERIVKGLCVYAK